MVVLALKCVLLAVLGTFTFDCVHYILHVFEHSRFRFLRRLGELHAIHHDFLDREMKLHRQYRSGNLLHHVLPEYGTAVVGMCVLSYLFFGWEAGVIVIAVRTVMVAVYVAQKGEDFTHAELRRIKARRSLIWVGPHYHALHHVYVRQHYSSFVNIFDMIFGTNCQIKDRRFLVTGANGAYGAAMVEALRAAGASVETATGGTDTHTDTDIREKLARCEVLVLADGAKEEKTAQAVSLTPVRWIDTFRELGRDRLVPPEVWVLGSPSQRGYARHYDASPDVTYRHIEPSSLPAKRAVKMNLFWIRRGFHYIPVIHKASPLKEAR